MLRNSEKPYGDGEGYKRFRGPHQSTDGPEQHGSYVDVVLAYTNLLEERIYVLDLELGAMRDRFGHQLDFRNQPEPTENMPDMASEPVNQVEAVRIRPHPWDELVIDASNPLGISARQRMLELAERVAALQTMYDNALVEQGRRMENLKHFNSATKRLEEQIAAVRTKNTELEAANNDLRAELAALAKGPGPAPEVQRPIRYEGLSHYQDQVRDVVCYHWGTHAYHNTEERALRFLEEAIELAQACHLDRGRAEALVAWVYSRRKGPIEREVGGVMVTLAALCGNLNVEMFVSGAYELDRLKAKTSIEMRERHAAKPDTIRSQR